MPSKPQAKEELIKVGKEYYTGKQLSTLYTKLKKDFDAAKSKRVCVCCNKMKPDEEFYEAFNPVLEAGYIPFCKDCIDDILYRKDSFGNRHDPTLASLLQALTYLNKPFYSDVYEECLQEAEGEFTQADFGKIYIRKITKQKYEGFTFADGDNIQTNKPIYKDVKELSQEDQEQLLSDMEDTIDILGFDPFEEEDAGDKRFLYSTFLSLADTGNNDEGNKMRAQSCVPIVRAFLQVQKIDNNIQDIMAHPRSLENDTKLLDKYANIKSTLQNGIVKLAETNLISEKNNKATSKGQGSWTNKLKKMKDLHFRAAENNRFSLMTCQGMQQVADISAQSIIKAIKLQDNEYSEMLADQTRTIFELRNDLDFQTEVSRLLLRENYDLKEILANNNINIDKNLIDLSELLFSSEEGDDSDAEVDS